MNDKNKKFLYWGLLFCMGLGAAFMAGRLFPGKWPPAPAAAKPAGVDRNAVARFLEAAKRGDYAEMAKTGDRVFPRGAKVAKSGELFKEYEANSFPPYTVYAFYSEGSDERVRRVLLTLDGEERVESFLAEEMAVVQ